MSHSPIDWTVVARHLAGDLTPEQRDALDAWIGNDPVRRAGIRELEQRWGLQAPNTPPYEVASYDSEALWRALQGRMHEHAHNAEPAKRGRPFTPARIHARSRSVVRVGVGAALAGLLAWGASTAIRSHPDPIGSRYATKAAQQATITLRDGTRVTLAPHTTLSVASTFGQGSRTVLLSGEAYFNVQAAPEIPFIVRTGTVVTRVLGTTFSVRSDPASDTVHVAVEAGKVVAWSPHASATIVAGRVAQLTDSTAITMSMEDQHIYTDWAKGRLVFDDVAVPSLLATVGRWYGYQFKLADSTLTSRHISVDFNVSDPREMIVVLKAVLAVNMSFDGTVVTLTPRQGTATSHSSIRKDVLKPILEMGR